MPEGGADISPLGSREWVTTIDSATGNASRTGSKAQHQEYRPNSSQDLPVLENADSIKRAQEGSPPTGMSVLDPVFSDAGEA